MELSKRFSFLLAACWLVPFLTFSQSPYTVNLVVEKGRQADLERQADLRKRNAWREFHALHPTWSVEFNESSGKPHRAFGAPIPTNGGTPEARAMDLISGALQGFGIPVTELVHANTTATARNRFIHFTQEHQGIPVIKGHLMVKLDQAGNAIAFGLEVHDDIELDLQPAIVPAIAEEVASEGLPGIGSIAHEGLRILPVPAQEKTDHRLVYELFIHATIDGRPAHFLCWVDAHTGKLWYRWDQVVECGHRDGGDKAHANAGADVQVNATTFISDPHNPTMVTGLPDLRLSINGNFMYTDADGELLSGIAGPVDAQVQLRGRWSNVTTNGITPSFNITLSEGSNTIDMDPVANIRQRSAYHFVNVIHERMNNVLPGFTGMDFALPTIVDATGGDCNAFYNGSSINFYAQGNGCYSLATVGDVVFHEYGHGINDRYYQSLGSSFTNGAMNEGYADIWAISVTGDPIIGGGYMIANANSFIRRYDQNLKVYPMDLVGQVHADGEIICGAWYDTYQLMDSDLDLMMELFAGAYPGLQANAFNGQEGQAFRDVLIDVLQADDDDGDITNGTPNGNAIIEGFAMHGITLISNADLQHAPLEASLQDEGITLDAQVSLTFPFSNYLSGVRVLYRINDSPEWESVLMTNTGGSNYSATIPGQPAGTVIAYYVGLEDIYGQIGSIKPVGATNADPNIPFFILVGVELKATEDGDTKHEFGPWSAGILSDNATTGIWEWSVPIGSFSVPGDPSTIVQTDHQHTPDGEFCWVTGNAQSPSASIGENDVDGGTTTLLSSTIDMSAYEEPILTYWRWYINNPPTGANPNADWWQTFISNDDGISWVPVEETKTSDRSWRRFAFRVNDYIEPTATMRFKFNASDSIRPGEYLDGGSLVEAAVDDIQLWDLATIISVPEHAPAISALYPDPANDVITLLMEPADRKDIRFEITDLSGRIVARPAAMNSQRQQIDVGALADGQYVLRVIWGESHEHRRFSVVR